MLLVHTTHSAESLTLGVVLRTSRILTIQTSSGLSVIVGPEPFWVNTAAAAVAVGAGHFHFGRASMAKVGVMKLKVPPWRIGNLRVSEVEVTKVRGQPEDYTTIFLMVSEVLWVSLWEFLTPPKSLATPVILNRHWLFP